MCLKLSLFPKNIQYDSFNRAGQGYKRVKGKRVLRYKLKWFIVFSTNIDKKKKTLNIHPIN